MNCRFCGAQLSQVFVDLGTAPPSNAFLTQDQIGMPEIYYPLKAFVCHSCFLVQIDQCMKANEIFSEDYVYLSSTSRTWLEHSRRYADSIVPRLKLSDSSMIIEIASNDGYLLQYFLQKKYPCLGVEPTHSTAKIARDKGLMVEEDFFGVRLALDLVRRGFQADLIICNNVLAHVPDLNDFVAGLRLLLKAEGTITLEFPHLLRLVENCQFDTIYHEHFSYFSFTTACEVLTRHGLCVHDVEELPTHGGSLRVYACHEASQRGVVSEEVERLIQRERELGVRSSSYYGQFANKVQKVKAEFLRFLLDAQQHGRLVAGYGAAAKGNTLLNYCGIRGDLVKFVVDAAPSKQGRFLPGSRIPVVTESALRAERPDYIVIFPWNLKEEIRRQISYVETWGARLVTAIPAMSIFETVD